MSVPLNVESYLKIQKFKNFVISGSFNCGNDEPCCCIIIRHLNTQLQTLIHLDSFKIGPQKMKMLSVKSFSPFSEADILIQKNL